MEAALLFAWFVSRACFFKDEWLPGKEACLAEATLLVVCRAGTACFFEAGRSMARRFAAFGSWTALFASEARCSFAACSAASDGAMFAWHAADITSWWDARHWNTRFTVGNGVRAKLEGVLHEPPPSSLSRQGNRDPVENGSDDQHKPLHGQASPVTTLRVRV